MEQGGSQNKNESFFKKYQNLVIGTLVVAAVVLYFIVQSQSNNGTDNGDDNGQNPGEVTNGQTPTPTPNPALNPTPTPVPAGTQSGNVSAAGTLRVSDNAARGNYMVDSNRGKIYISTRRDFSSQVGKNVTLNAQGNINNFTFIGFNETMGTTPAPTPTPVDVGGAPDIERGVRFSGELQNSNNAGRGNYMIVSGSTTVYLKSVHNYSAWVGSEVNLAAQGTINSFTNAVLTQR